MKGPLKVSNPIIHKVDRYKNVDNSCLVEVI